MKRPPTESDLLTGFELLNLRGDYREYFKTKRNNFFATMQELPDLWKCFQLLDQIWIRQFNDLQNLGDTKQMLPGLLFMNAHAKFRIAMELGFCCCLGEAWDILRGAIESVAHAHKLVREPHLMKVWLEKDDGKRAAEAFKDTFERNKKESLFPAQHGLDKLHTIYSQFSEWGTHTTVASIAQKFATCETSSHVEWKLNYTGAEPQVLTTSLFLMLVASALMERAFYGTYEARLQFDTELNRMRSSLREEAGIIRARTIKQFNLRPPEIWSV